VKWEFTYATRHFSNASSWAFEIGWFWTLTPVMSSASGTPNADSPIALARNAPVESLNAHAGTHENNSLVLGQARRSFSDFWNRIPPVAKDSGYVVASVGGTAFAADRYAQYRYVKKLKRQRDAELRKYGKNERGFEYNPQNCLRRGEVLNQYEDYRNMHWYKGNKALKQAAERAGPAQGGETFQFIDQEGYLFIDQEGSRIVTQSIDGLIIMDDESLSGAHDSANNGEIIEEEEVQPSNPKVASSLREYDAAEDLAYAGDDVARIAVRMSCPLMLLSFQKALPCKPGAGAEVSPADEAWLVEDGVRGERALGTMGEDILPQQIESAVGKEGFADAPAAFAGESFLEAFTGSASPYLAVGLEALSGLGAALMVFQVAYVATRILMVRSCWHHRMGMPGPDTCLHHDWY